MPYSKTFWMPEVQLIAKTLIGNSGVKVIRTNNKVVGNVLDIFFWFCLLDTKNIWQAILARFTLCNSHCVGSTDYSLFFYQKAETKIFLGDWDSKAGCEGGRSNYKKRSLSVTPTHYLKSLKMACYLFQEMSSK